MNSYRIFVACGARQTPFCDDFAADSLEQAIVLALRAAQEAGLRSDYIRKIEVLERKRGRGDA